MTAPKRAFDVVAAVCGLALAGPLLLAAALVIRLDDGGPVFFRQTRVGRNGRRFRIWKLRTMGAGTTGGELTVADDARVTRAGRWLRRAHLDEVPQLLNVLAGDMSIVGPRPEVPRFVACYTARQRDVLRHRPGITDPAALRFREEGRLLAGAPDPEEVYVREILPAKLALQIEYAERATLWSDLAVLVRTCLVGLAAARPRAPRPRAVRAARLPLAVVLAVTAAAMRPAALQSQTPGDAAPPAAPAAPMLQPGDVIRIDVWRQPELSGEFPVAPDGTVLHPLYREVRVAGVPIATVEERLRTLLLAYESAPQVVVEPRVRVAVSGEVREPGVFAVPIGTTLTHAVGLAGGPTDRGRLDRVTVLRGGTPTTVDLSAGSDGSLLLQSGDQITVARRSDVLRDQIGPLASLAAAVAAIVSVFVSR